MKKVVFVLTVSAITTMTSCTFNGKKPTVFVPCVATGENPLDRTECDCRMDRRIHQRDTSAYRDTFFRDNEKQGRAFWAGYIYLF